MNKEPSRKIEKEQDRESYTYRHINTERQKAKEISKQQKPDTNSDTKKHIN